jgi:hypothetical protein
MRPAYTRVGLILLAVGILVLGFAWVTYAPGAGDVGPTMNGGTR